MSDERQMLFAIEYVKDFNGTQAARRAGYQGNNNALAVTASRVLRYANVRKRISELLAANAMGSQEVLWRLGEQGRVNIAQFFKISQGGDVSLNWAAIRKHGYLIKSITWTKYGPRVELHDAQKALELIGKNHGLFTDKQEVEIKAPISIIEPVRPDDRKP